MNSQSQENSPSFNLPSPNSEQQAQTQEHTDGPANELAATKAVEQAKPTSSSTPADNTKLTQMMGPPPLDPTFGMSAAAAPQGSSMPQIADDTDLIEKEWVEKAKEIVYQTSQDPHLQNKEMNKVKVEYLKKRYNKDLKLDKE